MGFSLSSPVFSTAFSSLAVPSVSVTHPETRKMRPTTPTNGARMYPITWQGVHDLCCTPPPLRAGCFRRIGLPGRALNTTPSMVDAPDGHPDPRNVPGLQGWQEPLRRTLHAPGQ